MAQSGYTPILLYGSNTASSVPSASNLTSSTSGVELALNYTDGKLYYKDNSGVVQLLASKAAAAGVLSFSAGSTGLTPSTATSGAVTLAGTLGISNGGTGITSFGTGVQTALGVNVGTAGSFLVNGGVLGTPSSGTVTNLTGTASININGTVGATTPSTGAFTTLSGTGQLTLTNASDYNLYASGAGANYMAGSLGIGSAPVAKLDVYAASGYVDARVRSGSNQTFMATDGTYSYFGTYSNTPIVFSTNNINRGGISNSGTWSLGNAPGAESLRVTPVASAVNYLNVYGAATGNQVNMRAEGSDTNIGFNMTTKGAGGYSFYSGSYGGTQFAIANTASAVNYLQVTGSSSTFPALSAQGSSTNVDMLITTKGTGAINLQTNYLTQFVVTSTASAVNYLSVTGGSTGGAPVISSQGSDASIGLYYTTKSNSSHVFYTRSLSAPQFVIGDTASAVNYMQVTGGDGSTTSPVISLQGSSANITGQFYAKGTGIWQFFGGATEQFRIATTASAVNYMQVTGAATGGSPVLSAQGSDANVNLVYDSKGTALHIFRTNGGAQNQFVVSHSASAVNYLNATGAATGVGVSISAQGSDTNIDIALTPKGTGVLSFGTYTAGIVAQAGYISIKDAAGNVRRLLVG